MVSELNSLLLKYNDDGDDNEDEDNDGDEEEIYDDGDDNVGRGVGAELTLNVP